MPSRPRSTLRRRANWLVGWGGVVVCVMMAGLWVATVRWNLNAFSSFPSISAAGGAVLVGWDPGAASPFELPRLQVERRGSDWWWWFGHDVVETSWMGSFEYVAVPLWFPLGLAATSTGRAWRAELRRRRSRVGHCPTCAYDLAGLAAGAPERVIINCPECGTPARE